MEYNNTADKTPSSNAVMVILILTMIFGVVRLLAPAIYAQNHGISTGQANIIPEPGTVEYEQYTEQFYEEHGREFDVNDYLTGTKNGMAVFGSYMAQCFAFAAFCFTIYNLGVWAMENSDYKHGRTNTPPRPGRDQAYSTLMSLIAVGFLVFLSFAMLFMLTPSQ